jgi:DNA repair protein RecO (recombination protein O)
MLTSDPGIVLRHIPLGETSWIVSLLGAASGRVRLVARGARAPRSRLGAGLEVGNDLDLVFDLRPGRDLGYLREASVRRRPLATCRDLAAIGAGFAILEILERAIPEGGREVGLLDDVRGALGALGAGTGRARALLLLYAFERRLLDRLGLGPELDACADCSQAVERGGWLDSRAGTLRCRSCGRGGPGCHLLEAATLDLLRALATRAWDRVADPIPEARTRRAAGLSLHRLLGMHLEKYRLPAALRLIQKVDISASSASNSAPNFAPVIDAAQTT